MYDIERRQNFSTVGELKELLNDIPDNTQVTICGDSYAWFHVEKDKSVVTLDNEDLEECYESTGLDWDAAIDHLNMLIDMYESIGASGILGLAVVLLPLKKRYADGERTQKLYDEIMECE